MFCLNPFFHMNLKFLTWDWHCLTYLIYSVRISKVSSAEMTVEK